MASTADFKNGLTIHFSNDIYQIVEFQHVKPGKGGAFVRTKLKSLTTGKVIDNTLAAKEEHPRISPYKWGKYERKGPQSEEDDFKRHLSLSNKVGHGYPEEAGKKDTQKSYHQGI